MASFFLDTSYIIALEAADDQNHATASNHWQSLRGTASKLITTTYVFDEIVTFFNSRNRHAKAVEIGNRLLASPAVEVVPVGESLFSQGWQFFQKHSDKSYSLTDAISFLVMEQQRLTEALTFDRHFVQAGFIKLPE